uniref:Secreted protein n=1 Tax=Ascaris lumbricoides TaxID=6252 RepID=A0A0M3I0E1_ASCLU
MRGARAELCPSSLSSSSMGAVSSAHLCACFAPSSRIPTLPLTLAIVASGVDVASWSRSYLASTPRGYFGSALQHPRQRFCRALQHYTCRDR